MLRHTTLLLLSSTLLLSGCAANRAQPDPAYAPAMPIARPNAEVANGTIFGNGRSMLLFEDNKARAVGDILTVVLAEETNANKSANTDTNKSYAFDSSATIMGNATPTIAGYNPFTNAIESASQFSGGGNSSQSNSLSGNISVTVWDVLPNGNLAIRGEKLVTLNQGDEYIRIAGIVRPEDIDTKTNSIPSNKVANARISYSGEGDVASANVMGWLARFFMRASWMF